MVYSPMYIVALLPLIRKNKMDYIEHKVSYNMKSVMLYSTNRVLNL